MRIFIRNFLFLFWKNAVFVFKSIYIRRYFLLKIIFLFIIPFFLYWGIFEPRYINELPKTQDQNGMSLSKLSTINVIRMVISNIIDTPLNLGFRNFCIKNDGLVWINEKLVTKEQSKISGIGIAEVNLKINDGKVERHSVKSEDEKCIPFIKKDDQINYEYSRDATLVKPEDTILRQYFSPNPDITKPEYKISINLDNIRFFYKKNIYDNFAKGIIFFIFWESLVILVIKIYKLLKFGYKNV